MRTLRKLFTLLFALCLGGLSPSLVRIKAEAKPGKDRQSLAKQASEFYAQNWVEQDVAYIITDVERSAFQQLTSDEERFRFIEQFWLRRDPTYHTVENEVKQEHYRRLADAIRKFTSDVPGWRTDRGLIYVLLGPPEKIEFPPPSGTLPSKSYSETWHYSTVPGFSTGKETILEFVDKSRNGSYRLNATPAAEALLDWLKVGLPREKSNNIRCHGGPQMQYKDLETVLNVRMNYDLLPFRVRTTFEKVTDATVLTTIGIQLQNKDLSYEGEYGSALTTVRIFGRIADSLGRWTEPFETEVRAGGPKPFLMEVVEGTSYAQKTIPLKAGHYKLELALKDLNSGKLGTLYQSIVVPEN